MSPKDIALVAWSLGRLQFPKEQLLCKKLTKKIEGNLSDILKEEYLFDPKDLEQLSNEFQDVIKSSETNSESEKDGSTLDSQESNKEVEVEAPKKAESYITF